MLLYYTVGHFPVVSSAGHWTLGLYLDSIQTRPIPTMLARVLLRKNVLS